MLLFFRLGHSHREIIPLDKWEILPEQLEYEEKLGQGAFGVVHKAILKRRAGLEVFYTGNQVIKQQKKASQVVAVKELKGNNYFVICNEKQTRKEF